MNPRVVVIGAGFGGLTCARELAGQPLDVTVIDRHNYHLFQPLLYQVASSLLNPADIAFPVRSVFRKASNVRCRLGEVRLLDLRARRVHLRDGSEVPWDRLVIATGSTTNYFGLAEIERGALPLKDLPDAVAIRNHVLTCFEAASAEAERTRRRRWLTFVIVGGGPTGIEYAGALSELVRFELRHDYPEIEVGDVRILLLEALDRLLPAFSPPLSEEARRILERRGIEVRLGTRVEGRAEGGVGLADGERLEAATLIWAAGVKPAVPRAVPPLPEGPGGRIEVDERLRVLGLEGVYALGDAALARDAEGEELPMLAPAAMQAGRFVAKALVEELEGRSPEPFHFKDKGIMATIGRNAAVAERGSLKLRGFIGWLAWLALHLYFIIGFRNRMWVLMGWAWNYLLFHRPIRLILEARPHEPPALGEPRGRPEVERASAG